MDKKGAVCISTMEYYPAMKKRKWGNPNISDNKVGGLWGIKWNKSEKDMISLIYGI